MTETGKGDGQRAPPKKPKPAPPPPPRNENQALPVQNRKLLGKHYANRYRTNRRGG